LSELRHKPVPRHRDIVDPVAQVFDLAFERSEPVDGHKIYHLSQR